MKKIKFWALCSKKENDFVGVLPLGMSEADHYNMVYEKESCAAIFSTRKWAVEYQKAIKYQKLCKIIPCEIILSPKRK